MFKPEPSRVSLRPQTIIYNIILKGSGHDNDGSRLMDGIVKQLERLQIREAALLKELNEINVRRASMIHNCENETGTVQQQQKQGRKREAATAQWKQSEVDDKNQTTHKTKKAGPQGIVKTVPHKIYRLATSWNTPAVQSQRNQRIEKDT